MIGSIEGEKKRRENLVGRSGLKKKNVKQVEQEIIGSSFWVVKAITPSLLLQILFVQNLVYNDAILITTF